jgi:DNA repair protein RadC
MLMDESEPPEDDALDPGHAGHRERLRLRARTAGMAALPDYELLEMYLFRTIARGDVKPRAKALLARFGSLAEVMAAPVRELQACPGIGQATAEDLRMVHELTLRVARAEVVRRPVIASWTALLSYVRVSLAHERREQFRVLFLDRKNQLICDEMMGHGTVDQAPVYPREIMRRALELSASALILVHNHPSGDPTPSKADIAMTLEVVEAGRPLQIKVHDHLVVGREGVASFKALGLY